MRKVDLWTRLGALAITAVLVACPLADAMAATDADITYSTVKLNNLEAVYGAYASTLTVVDVNKETGTINSKGNFQFTLENNSNQISYNVYQIGGITWNKSKDKFNKPLWTAAIKSWIASHAKYDKSPYNDVLELGMSTANIQGKFFDELFGGDDAVQKNPGSYTGLSIVASYDGTQENSVYMTENVTATSNPACTYDEAFEAKYPEEGEGVEGIYFPYNRRLAAYRVIYNEEEADESDDNGNPLMHEDFVFPTVDKTAAERLADAGLSV